MDPLITTISLDALLSALRTATPAASASLAARVAEYVQSGRAHAAGPWDQRWSSGEFSKVAEEQLTILLDAVESREPFFSGHSRRVALLATCIVRAAEIPELDSSALHIGAMFHDLGMCYASFSSLTRKSGRLTPSEWEVFKGHPRLGASLLESVPTLRVVAPMVLHHHENWDGTGYPAGLTEDRIPIGSRVIMMAETIDAMTTDRPYRSALSYEHCREELEKYAGQQFDPYLCSRVTAPESWASIVEIHRHAAAKTGPIAGRDLDVTTRAPSD